MLLPHALQLTLTPYLIKGYKPHLFGAVSRENGHVWHFAQAGIISAPKIC